jgi:hypothetical protein
MTIAVAMEHPTALAAPGPGADAGVYAGRTTTFVLTGVRE